MYRRHYRRKQVQRKIEEDMASGSPSIGVRKTDGTELKSYKTVQQRNEVMYTLPNE